MVLISQRARTFFPLWFLEKKLHILVFFMKHCPDTHRIHANGQGFFSSVLLRRIPPPLPQLSSEEDLLLDNDLHFPQCVDGY